MEESTTYTDRIITAFLDYWPAQLVCPATFKQLARHFSDGMSEHQRRAIGKLFNKTTTAGSRHKGGVLQVNLAKTNHFLRIKGYVVPDISSNEYVILKEEYREAVKNYNEYECIAHIQEVLDNHG